jgi:uncharacterized Fe-S cluster-containing radical SAM superfamily protein
VNAIDTTPTARRMRSRLIRPEVRSVLLSRLDGSSQEADLTLPPNCGGVGRVRHFRRATAAGWPENSLPIDPAAKALGLSSSEMVRAQVFQNAACAWRCWYCYVPFELLAGDEARSEWVDASGMIARYAAEPDPPRILDLSGGSPDLTPEWVLWTMQELRRAGLENDTYLWSDDNLSTDFFFDELSAADRRIMADYRNYGRVCCFKGFDRESFSFNTTADAAAYDDQFARFARYLDAGLDLYAYVTLTGPSVETIPDAIEAFVDRLQAISLTLPLRTVPLRIEPFGPMLARRQRRDVDRALGVQEAAIARWNDIIARRFNEGQRATSIADVTL